MARCTQWGETRKTRIHSKKQSLQTQLDKNELIMKLKKDRKTNQIRTQEAGTQDTQDRGLTLDRLQLPLIRIIMLPPCIKISTIHTENIGYELLAFKCIACSLFPPHKVSE